MWRLAVSVEMAAALTASQMSTINNFLEGGNRQKMINAHVKQMSVTSATKVVPSHIASMVETNADLDNDAVDKAITRLNGMIETAQKEIDQKLIECKEFHARNRQNFNQIVTDLARFGNEIASAGEKRSSAIADISDVDARLADLKKERLEAKVAFEAQRALDKADLSSREADLAVGEFIMEVTKCKPGEEASLVEKHHVLNCAAQRGHHSVSLDVLKFADPHVQAKLAALVHPESRRMAATALSHTVAGEAVSFIEKQGPTAAVAAQPTKTDIPVTTPGEKNARKCTLDKPNCGLLHDNFSLMWGEMKDAVDELTAAMTEKRAEYKERMDTLDDQVRAANADKASASTRMAEATADINAYSDAQKEKQTEEHDISAEFKIVWGECKETLHELVFTRKCGCTKVRDQIKQNSYLEDKPLKDCEVSDFIPGECSSECDEEMLGGQLQQTREVVTEATPAVEAETPGGARCPDPMTYTMQCNQIKCPVHCRVSQWSGWSACSKECGGGLKTRTRNVITQPANGGESCDAVSEDVPCNTGSCDRDCSLHGWTRWTGCTQACDGGYKEKFRHLHRGARGQGKCPRGGSRRRYKKKKCNKHPCMGDEKCVAQMDLVIAIDGSGSLRGEGWKTVANFTGEYVKRLEGEAYMRTAMKVGVVQYGNGEILDSGVVSPAIRVSGLKRPGPEMVEQIVNLKWQKGFTNMAQAAVEAQLVLSGAGGRATKQSAVLFVTDGKPSFQFETKTWIDKLRDKGVLVYTVVIADKSSPEMDLAIKYSSVPWQTHVVQVPSLDALSQDVEGWVSKTIVQTCPRAESKLLEEWKAKQRGFELMAAKRDCPSWWNWLGNFDSAEKCKSVALKKGVKAFVWGTGVFDYYGGDCFAQKNGEKSCDYGWVKSRFDAYELYEGDDEESDESTSMLAAKQPMLAAVNRPGRPKPARKSH